MENGYSRNPGNRVNRAANREDKRAGNRVASARSLKRLLVRLPAIALLIAGLALAGCKEDCSAAAKLGDFEFSQGNYVNAVKQYEKALKADANCGIVGQKLADAKRRIAEEK